MSRTGPLHASQYQCHLVTVSDEGWVDEGHVATRLPLDGQVVEGEAVTVASLVDSEVGAFGSSGSDSFEDFGDRSDCARFKFSGGKSCLVGDLAADDVEGSQERKSVGSSSATFGGFGHQFSDGVVREVVIMRVSGVVGTLTAPRLPSALVSGHTRLAWLPGVDVVSTAAVNVNVTDSGALTVSWRQCSALSSCAARARHPRSWTGGGA
jgi:hypothetical protein